MKKKSKLQKKIDDVSSRLWRNKADKAFRDLVFLQNMGICAICAAKEYIQVHHLISRNVLIYRHKVENGITLCPAHHKYSFLFSAHKNPIRFAIWLQEKDPNRWIWLQDALNNLEEKLESEEKPNYKEIYLELKEKLDSLKPSTNILTEQPIEGQPKCVVEPQLRDQQVQEQFK